MSVSKDPRSPYWRFDFQYRGHRFFGSTKATTKREAEAVERQERERAKAQVAQTEAAKTSLRIDDVAGRYWLEVGQHVAGARDIHRVLGYLIEHLGKDKLLTEIDGNDVARLVAWRRGHRNSKGELLSPFTVNDTTKTLKTLFTRAKAWGVRFEREPEWKQFWLKEPPERVRELVGDEAERIEAATRDDFAPFFAFAKASGLRLSECLLTLERGGLGGATDQETGQGWPYRHGADHADDPRASYGRCRGIIPSTCSPSWRAILRRGVGPWSTLSDDGAAERVWKETREAAGVPGFPVS